MRFLLQLVVLITFGLGVSALQAQDTEALQSRLVGHSLYLRGMWTDNWLEFNGDGTLRGKSSVGPLTRSGVDVLSVKQNGEGRIEILGQRIVFGWKPDGTLLRIPLKSKTRYVNEFGWHLVTLTGKFEVKILVRADATGSYDRALHAIFADGLQDLATSAPKPWACWGRGYFVEHPDLNTAKQTVDACIQEKSLARAIRHTPDGPNFKPPQLIGKIKLPFASQGVTIHAKGTDEIAYTVSIHGIAVGFQIRRASGFGMDEAVLQGLAEARFTPATIDGQPVVADMNYLADLEALTQ